MSEQLLAPLVLPHINLKDVPSVLLDIDRLLESDFWLSTNGEESRAGLCLWLKSFKQLPAGSLPDDDTSLARLCQLAPDQWSSVRPKALHGWIKCDDGRLYHKTVSEKVLLMHMYRLVQRIRGAKGMEVRYNIDRDSDNDSVVLMHEVHACLELLEAISAGEAKKFREKYARTLTSSAMQSSGRRVSAKAPPQKDLLGSDVSSPSPTPVTPKSAAPKQRRAAKVDGLTYSSAFVRFWEVYPRKREGRQSAVIAWEKQNLDGEIEAILKDIRQRKATDQRWQEKDNQYVPLPATYMNQRRWDNEIDPSKVVDQSKGTVDTQSLPLPGTALVQPPADPWWIAAGFTSKIEAENDGCHEKKHQFFQNGVRIKDVYGNPRPKGEIFSDLTNRITRWMMNFTNEAFSLERDHALRMMRKMPRIDFWSMLRGKTRDEHLDALRTLLMALPDDCATGKALRA